MQHKALGFPAIWPKAESSQAILNRNTRSAQDREKCRRKGSRCRAMAKVVILMKATTACSNNPWKIFRESTYPTGSRSPANKKSRASARGPEWPGCRRPVEGRSRQDLHSALRWTCPRTRWILDPRTSKRSRRSSECLKERKRRERRSGCDSWIQISSRCPTRPHFKSLAAISPTRTNLTTLARMKRRSSAVFRWSSRSRTWILTIRARFINPRRSWRRMRRRNRIHGIRIILKSSNCSSSQKWCSRVRTNLWISNS